MKEIIFLASILIFLLGTWLFVKMFEYGEAFEWFLDNERHFQKHFAGEFIFINVNVSSGRVTFDFEGKGKSYHVDLSLVDAKRVYDATQNGGMRMMLIPLAK